MKTPPECLSCHRPIRREGRLVHQEPGTVRHGGRGLCQRCSQHPEIREQYDRLVWSGPDLLDEVERLMRYRAPQDIVEALGVKASAVARAARRYRRPELARPFEHLVQRDRTARDQARRREQRSAA